MAKVSPSEMRMIEQLFDMKSGYVMNLSNRDFQDLIHSSSSIDTSEIRGYTQGLSKANILRHILISEQDRAAGAILNALLDYSEIYRKEIDHDSSSSIVNLTLSLRDVARRLQQTDPEIELPSGSDDMLLILEAEIARGMKSGSASLIVDRLHTYSTRYIKSILIKHMIYDDSFEKDAIPLQSMYGRLHKYYIKENCYKNRFTELVIKTGNSWFEEFNKMRNGRSLAHDNPLLTEAESQIIIIAISTILRCIHLIEL